MMSPSDRTIDDCYVEYKLGRSVIQVDEDEDPMLAQVLGKHL
jgi:hypothetical protein